MRLCASSDLNLKDKWALRLCFNASFAVGGVLCSAHRAFDKIIKSKDEPRRSRDKKFLILFAVAFIGFAAMPFCYAPAALERAGVVLAGCRLRRICACDAVCYMKFHASGALKCRFVY